MINKNSGIISINEIAISSKLNKSSFLASKMAEYIESEEIHVYSNYYMKPQDYMDMSVRLILYFDQSDKLDMVNIYLNDSNSEISWKNWSKEKEMKHKLAHDKWLKSELGEPPYCFNWGNVTSSFNSRSGSSSITINYNS
jgi:hypothetical protein